MADTFIVLFWFVFFFFNIVGAESKRRQINPGTQEPRGEIISMFAYTRSD